MAVKTLKEASSEFLQATVAAKILARLTKQETSAPATPDTTLLGKVCLAAAARVQAEIGAVADADPDVETEIDFLIAMDLTSRLALARLQATYSGTHNKDVTAELRAIEAEITAEADRRRDEVGLEIDRATSSTRSALLTQIQRINEEHSRLEEEQDEDV